MTSSVKLGIIDDDSKMMDSIKSNLDDIGDLNISCFTDIKDFEPEMDKIDIAIVDLCLDANCMRGKPDVFQGKGIVSKFNKMPLRAVIIYSAFGDSANWGELPFTEGPFIKNITKGNENELHEAVNTYAKMFFGINELKEDVDKAFTDLVLEDAQELFGEVGTEKMTDAGLKAYFSFRLSTIVSNKINSMEGRLPSQAIFMPPLTPTDHEAYPVTTGDIFSDKAKGDLYMVVSPACDLVYEKSRKPKTCNVLLARLYRKKEDAECKIQDREAEDEQQHVKISLNRNLDNSKHYFAPKKLSDTGEIFIPFKNPEVLGYDELRKMEKVATMAIPFSYEVQAGFAREIMRLGTPDLTDPEKQGKK